VKQYGVYLVTGRREYRGHPHGTVFEEALDKAAAARAIARGDIRLIREVIPDLEPGSYRLGADWPPPTDVPPAPKEAPNGRLSHSREE
jgi:hypothetical protein